MNIKEHYQKAAETMKLPPLTKKIEGNLGLLYEVYSLFAKATEVLKPVIKRDLEIQALRKYLHAGGITRITLSGKGRPHTIKDGELVADVLTLLNYRASPIKGLKSNEIKSGQKQSALAGLFYRYASNVKFLKEAGISNVYLMTLLSEISKREMPSQGAFDQTLSRALRGL